MSQFLLRTIFCKETRGKQINTEQQAKKQINRSATNVRLRIYKYKHLADLFDQKYKNTNANKKYKYKLKYKYKTLLPACELAELAGPLLYPEVRELLH